jgi:hypothetical protein
VLFKGKIIFKQFIFMEHKRAMAYASQVVKAPAICVTVKTCVEWRGCTHCMDSFFSCPYALDGLHILAVSDCVTVKQSC